MMRLVIREGLALSLVGLGLGLAAALALTRLLGGLLYEISASDPLTFVAIGGLLLLAATAACLLPAHPPTARHSVRRPGQRA